MLASGSEDLIIDIVRVEDQIVLLAWCFASFLPTSLSYLSEQYFHTVLEPLDSLTYQCNTAYFFPGDGWDRREDMWSTMQCSNIYSSLASSETSFGICLWR